MIFFYYMDIIPYEIVIERIAIYNYCEWIRFVADLMGCKLNHRKPGDRDVLGHLMSTDECVIDLVDRPYDFFYEVINDCLDEYRKANSKQAAA